MRTLWIPAIWIAAVGAAQANAEAWDNNNGREDEEKVAWGEHWSTSILGKYAVTDSDRDDIDYGAGFRFGLSHAVTRNLDLELNGFGNVLRRDSRSGNDWQYGLGLDGLYYLFDQGPTPYAIAGGGAVYNDYSRGNATAPFVNAGMGLKLRDVWENVSVRAEARYHADWADDAGDNARYDDIRLYVGVEIPVFRAPTPEPKTVQITKPTRVIERERVVERFPETQRLDGIQFDFDSADIDRNGRVVLRGVADELRQHPDVTVEIGGHTCNIGTAQYNRELSLRRARAVKAYLVERGIEPERMSVRGYGFDRPIASNETEAGREQNRRIELRRTDPGRHDDRGNARSPITGEHRRGSTE